MNYWDKKDTKLLREEYPKGDYNNLEKLFLNRTLSGIIGKAQRLKLKLDWRIRQGKMKGGKIKKW